MPQAIRESGSFRDRRGRISYIGDRVLRTVMPIAADDFEFVRATGLVDELCAAGKLIGETEVDKNVLGEEGAAASRVIEHPRLPFISYPYEWTFSALKAAAILHLDIQQAALRKNVTLSDASAYNVQFQGSEPIFIDSLSFRRYHDGEYWAGHRQFCEQFVNPLLLRCKAGIPHNAWYRGALEGIPAEELARVLPWTSRLSWNTLTNVHMQARLQRVGTSAEAIKRAAARKLPRIGFEQMLHSLRKWVARMQLPGSAETVWEHYAGDNSYANEEAANKRRFVAEFSAAVKPGLLFDIGCNTGDYSQAALENGTELVVGFDFDHGALEAAFARARSASLNFLPLQLDAANPSPDQGWLQAERQGLNSRARGDGVIALALIHHLAIAKNLPLQQVIEWLTAMAPQGVLEFVPKSDDMVQRLLQLREDLFDDYDQETFESHLNACCRIVKSETVSSGGRTVYWFDRR